MTRARARAALLVLALILCAGVVSLAQSTSVESKRARALITKRGWF
jgi:hypothetical protein